VKKEVLEKLSELIIAKMRLFFVLFLFIFVSCSSEVIEPLEVDVSSGVVNGTLYLDTDVQCDVRGGKEPYSYTWGINGEIIKDCTSLCGFEIGEIGVYEVECNVIDSLGNETSDSIILIVEKEKINVDTIIVFGDSLTYGHALENPEEDNWAKLFSDELNAELYNYAFDGAKTSDILETQLIDYGEDTLTGENKLVFLWIGTNDIVALVSKEEFRDNYINIVEELVQIDDSELILINIADASKLSVTEDVEKGINELLEGFGFTLAIKRLTKDVVASYNNIIYEIADEYSLIVVDMYSFMDNFDDNMISDDRFHPNELGHELIKEEISTGIEFIYPEKEFI